MKIDKRLNMVVPVERDDGTTVYVHSSPVSADIFNQNYKVMARALSAIYAGGLGHIMGLRIAAKALVDVGQQMDMRASAEAVLAEIRRLSIVLVESEGRWVQMPFVDAVARGLIDEQDGDEVENAITFFTLVSAVHRRRDAEPLLAEGAKFWSAQLTSSNPTAYAASLPTSTRVAATGAKAPQSFIPS